MKNNLSTILGERLITIGEVSEGTGLHRNTISKIYHRQDENTGIKVYKAICDFLRIPLSELIEYVPGPSQKYPKKLMRKE
ncbi:helix-turn-helix domain-containing protein [Pediococcus pentosaceus]|uniref:Helix-turn-helix transcriptional regulator n=1 Tax=Pediococcus pentosaceus TaxID=1255 RepID=A0AA40X977_PEDPE|nr:helix-turn-helix transcriptional regulator [Pediococcus pentosaceus]MBF7127263.1 helix-turn-helix transcriptional regulator [Pediococcus pentosaceus]MBF7136400.1 helix-turn-helix transcriptional regulator [Pediococcus pentosaceus]MCM6819366.1 helix-turn-helix transcriptional regulator [Pediococcus pentosaceus]MCQ9315757.1 helix-turn-helix transcriptional regulator [Pediococcus pentosaceus]MCQ9339479.1 helix-turn-helix transcriptional regulator [Pediococcus pentosaceus]